MRSGTASFGTRAVRVESVLLLKNLSDRPPLFQHAAFALRRNLASPDSESIFKTSKLPSPVRQGNGYTPLAVLSDQVRVISTEA